MATNLSLWEGGSHTLKCYPLPVLFASKQPNSTLFMQLKEVRKAG